MKLREQKAGFAHLMGGEYLKIFNLFFKKSVTNYSAMCTL